MSDDEGPKYKDGDVVWVKLGSCWWPGEVTETPPEDYTSKKPPLAIVKFFNENTYEFVKAPGNIHFYNSARKHEFIRKGMDSYRGQNSHMEKFPGDVLLAEVRTDGNPNILSDPTFAPKKKNSAIIAEVFGSPSPKKTPKENRHSRGKATSKHSGKKKQTVNVTHRRFLGCDDYKAHVRLQYPGKDTELASVDSENAPEDPEPSQTFNCSTCTFDTPRLEVMLFHVQCHIKGVASPVQVKRKHSPKKKKPRAVKRLASDDERTNSSGGGFFDSDSEEEKPRPKKRKISAGPKKPKQKKVSEEKSVVDIRTNLLAEWSDSDEGDKAETSALDTSEEFVEKKTTKDGEEEREKEPSEKESKAENQTEKDVKSCFDFDEEEEEDNSIVPTALGRKIPRVIPPTEKRKSTDPDNEDASLPIAEDDLNRMEILKVSESLNDSSSSASNDVDLSKNEEVFNDLMDSTSVPQVPEAPTKTTTTSPPQKNFPDAQTAKIPDRKVEPAAEVATKLTNPKKRFVKSFEDFELLQNEQRRAQEEKEEEMRKERAVVVEAVPEAPSPTVEDDAEDDSSAATEEVGGVEDDKSEVEEIKSVEEAGESSRQEFREKSPLIEEENEVTEAENDEPAEEDKSVEEAKECVDIAKEQREESVSKIEEEPKVELVSKMEEPKVESVSKMEEEPKVESVSRTEEEPKVEYFSKVEEEPKVGLELNDSKKFDSNVQISKLKCQIMSKLSDDEPEASKLTKNKSPHHRTPRSKILESYRNDKSKEQKTRKSVDEKVPVEDKSDHHVPKKSKYLKFNEESGDSVEKMEEEPVKEEEASEAVKEEAPKPVEEEAPKAVEEEAPKPVKEEPPKSDIIKEVEAIPEKNPDEEIGKIKQIDDYLNDFLFDYPKKVDTPPKVAEEEAKPEDREEKKDETEESSVNEVHIKCAPSDDEQEVEEFAIKTNLTNFNRSEEEMSALSTLAMVSQLETNLEKPPEEEKVKIPEPKPEPELVPIDGNLTVTVSEKDLADGQVEITATSPPYKKPVTLTNFSMDFSECNSNSNSDSMTSELEEKPKEVVVKKMPGPNDVFDLEDHIPSQIVDKSSKHVQGMPAPTPTPPAPAPPASSSKLLERLTEQKPKENNSSTPKIAKVPMTKDSTKLTKSKYVVKPPAANKLVKATPPAPPQSNKPIILSEKIIKPVKTTETSSGSVSVQKITSKRNLHDADEIDAFIIQKGAKKEQRDEELEEVDEAPPKKMRKSVVEAKKATPPISAVKKRGKAKILQQTIFTPAGEIIQPNVAAAPTAAPPPADDNVFDINSMPIVLSDQILTPESIENMPIYLSDTTVQSTPEPVTPAPKIQTATIVKKTPVAVPVPHSQTPMRVLNKSISTPTAKLVKTPKILGSVGSKIVKHNVFTSGSSKHGKYVIVTQPTATTTTSKYTVGKKQAFIKRVTGDVPIPATGTLTKVQNLGTTESTGNKIMILTDQQGQQQRVLLTPAQQKMMGYQSPGTKITKTVMKGNVIQKGKDGQMTAIPSSSGLISKTVTPSRLNSGQTLISSSGHVLTPIHSQQAKSMRMTSKTHMISTPDRKIQMPSQRIPVKPPQQKTILIKNQHGQTVRKIQGTDDAQLDRQVQEQIEAIKASGALQQKQEILNYKTTHKTAFRRSYAKKIETPKPPTIVHKPKETAVPPPLAPISPKRVESEKQTVPQEAKQERALHQLVIQDAVGNQTTITEGQILALPSETVDGQPQSYMLVTLDDSGNLTPLNNEALLSLDPNLGLGGDLGNTVLQIDQSALKEEISQAEDVPPPKTEPEVVQPPAKEEKQVVPPPAETVEVSQEQIADSSVMQTIGETGQQLIVTGDPIAAQKFLESLTEGNTDLANILASAEGSSILIHADGQQILINTDADNQMLLSVNTDSMNMSESTEGGGNPIFATQPKNQDILAAALADTDVFQQEQSSQSKVAQLSPHSTLYPMTVGNVLETSLTLNSPIMTPLEVPSTNSKKISDESDILNPVPKNVDLPITITDPNIAQTVAQQQVASLLVNDLQNNLELSLPISDSTMTVTSSDINSPSFVYSLPSLDAADITQKPFNSSMPLLTEDAEEVITESKVDDAPAEEKREEGEAKAEPKITSDGSFMDENEGLCTLGGEMCSSLSEPPPDMFDLSAVLSSHQLKSASAKDESAKEEQEKVEDKAGDESASSESANLDTASVTETSSPNTTNEDSCEIPVQPEIVTTLKEDDFECGGVKRISDEVDSKKCKFD